MTTVALPRLTSREPKRRIPVVVTLGVFEGRQMVRHPMFWLGCAVSVGMSAVDVIQQAPVLNRVSVTLAWTASPIAVVITFLAGWAVLRARGRTDADPPIAMPAPMSKRVAGILIGAAWPAAATFALQLVILGWTLLRGPVTSIVWTELLVGPLLVAIAGSLSVAATRWIPHVSTPLVALFFVVGVQIALPFNAENWGSHIGRAALAPIVLLESILPYEIAFRPSGLHLAYLVGLLATFSGLATLGRSKVGVVCLGSGVFVAGLAGPAQLGPIDHNMRAEAMAALVGEEADLACETHETVTYCAMPGYDRWIDTWREAADLITARVPGEPTPIEVRQYPVHNTFLLDGGDYPDWWWITASYGYYEDHGVVPVGSVLADYTIRDEFVYHLTSGLIGCHQFCPGEAQQLANLWLLAADPHLVANIQSNTSDNADVASCIFLDLWQLPDAAARVQSSWVLLIDPATTYEDAGVALGVNVPIPTNEFDGIEGGCP